MPNPSTYQVRLSSYPNYQKTFGKVIDRARKIRAKENTQIDKINEDRDPSDFEPHHKRISQKTIILAGLVSLKHIDAETVGTYLKKLKIDKNPNRPDNHGAAFRAVELTLHDTAFTKKIIGDIAFDLGFHDITQRQVYHIGTMSLTDTDDDQLSALLMAAEAMTRDLNP